MENNILCEEETTEIPTIEQMEEECRSLHEQNGLLIKQLTSLEDRYTLEKERWKTYRCDMKEENDKLRDAVINLEQEVSKQRLAKSQDRKKRVATVPKLVAIAGSALVLLVVPYFLHSAGVIDPRTSFAIQSGLLMAIAWCYALIWDRTKA